MARFGTFRLRFTWASPASRWLLTPVLAGSLWATGATADEIAPASTPTNAPEMAAAASNVPANGWSAAPMVDEGVLLEAINTLLNKANEPARVAIVLEEASDPDDKIRRQSLERSLVRAARDRRREDIVTPTLVRARLGANAAVALSGGDAGDVGGLAADHVLLGSIQSDAGKARLALKLVVSATGAVVGSTTVPVEGTAKASTARAQDVDVAAADLADAVAQWVEQTGVDVRSHRVAVPPAQATGAAKEARLDRFVPQAITGALRDRGFLVAERTQVAEAMNQLALAEMTDSTDAGPLGELLGAQSLLLVQVAEAADVFLVTTRLVGVETGTVLGATSSTLKRDNVVNLAAVETRTPGEAAVRSAIAPGWGQAYNGEGAKAVVFGVTTYGALLTTVGLGVGAGLSFASYNAVDIKDGVDATQAQQQALDLRAQTNTLITATAISGAVTAAVWSLGIADALVSGD